MKTGREFPVAKNELSPSIHEFDDELIQTSAERLDMSLRPERRPRGSSTCLKAELLRPKGSVERSGRME